MIRLSVSIVLILVEPLSAEDWPQFRGPNRGGAWSETGLLKTFSAEGLRIRWRQPIGRGWSSPVVAQGRVYLTDSELHPPAAKERILCFEEKTGALLWTYSYEVTYPEWAFNPEHGGGPTATPIAEDGKVYTLGGSGQVHCLKAESGGLLWEKDLGKVYDINVLSCRASPLIEDNLLILFTGAKPRASVLALNKETGEEVWKALGDAVSNSSPIVVEAGGRRQLIVWSCDSLASLNPLTGEIYWRDRLVTSSNDAIPTPVFQNNHLLVSGLMLELDRDQPAAAVVWPATKPVSKRILSNTSTPLLQGDYVYSARSSGELVCLKAETGEQVWEATTVTDLESGSSIHLTPAGDVIFLFTDQGDLILAQLDANGYREISRAHLLAPTSPFGSRKRAWTPPSFANRHIFARNDEELVCATLEEIP